MTNTISSTLYGISRIKKRKEIAKKFNLDLGNILDLSGGDNLFIPPDLIQKLITKEVKKIDPRDSYPIDYPTFIEEISRFIGINTDLIYPGFSHTTLIQRLLSILTKPKDTIMILNPEKDIYQKMAQNRQLKVEKINLAKNYELDLEKIFEIIEEKKPSTILFSSPHFPTGNQFAEKKILTLAKETNIPLIIDESYVEFGKYSLVNQAEYYNNLNIVRNFSKAWGLGAFSSAYVVSNSEIISRLRTQYLIEEIPPIHVLATMYILQNPYRFVELIQKFIQERKRVYEHLRLLNGVRAFRSDTNFIFLQFSHPTEDIFEHLCSKGIIVQNFETLPLFPKKDNSLLVTLGTRAINDKFIISLIEVLEAII
ncbi:MAG: aminotransferase class I/II-fold pyridoxal phosphate-dependent enzyme [Candidatus Heimdallarchaeaceae archaeon]